MIPATVYILSTPYYIYIEGRIPSVVRVCCSLDAYAFGLYCQAKMNAQLIALVLRIGGKVQVRVVFRKCSQGTRGTLVFSIFRLLVPAARASYKQRVPNRSIRPGIFECEDTKDPKEYPTGYFRVRLPGAPE